MSDRPPVDEVKKCLDFIRQALPDEGPRSLQRGLRWRSAYISKVHSTRIALEVWCDD